MKDRRMKKICHVTSAHLPEDGRIFRRACVSAANSGYETYLVEQGDTYKKSGVYIVGIGKPEKKGRIYRMIIFARKAYEKAKIIDADLYQLHDPELLPYAKKLKRMGKAVIFDSHEDYVLQFRNKSYLPPILSAFLSKWFSWYSKRIFGMIDGLTYPGNNEYKSVFEGLNKRVVATDNFPWLSELYDKYDENFKKEPNTVCYIGGLDENRGITQIIKACGAARCKLYLAGEFESEDYRKSLEKLNEYSCVEYLGVIGREDVVRLLQKVTVGICTLLDVGQYYKMHNLPTKVYEYMSMSLPVVLHDSPYNIKINNDLHIGCCVNPLDVVNTSKVIRSLLDDPDKCKEYGRNGRKAIKNRFCWDHEQEKLLTMYKEILEK